MIIVESGPLAEMKSHAQTIFPDECCGFLYGAEHTVVQPNDYKNIWK